MSYQQATIFPESVIEGQIDSDFVIYGFSNSFTVPQWIPEKRAKSCNHCKDQLKSNCTHNCRLCGNVFCSHCTAKHNLPERFEQKDGKTGPMRVCYGCKMTCIRMRQAALNLPLDSTTRMLTVPQWQEIKTYIACQKCAVKRRNPHNCRLCGVLYCSDCTTKMNINLPPKFNKKNKQGPHRVCDPCRYRVLAGARIDDGSQQHIQEFLQRQQSIQDAQPNRFPNPLRAETTTDLDGVQVLSLHRHSISQNRLQTPTLSGGQPSAENMTSIAQNLNSLSLESPTVDGRFLYATPQSGNSTPNRAAVRSQRYANAASSGTGSTSHRRSVSSDSSGLTTPVEHNIPSLNLPTAASKDKPPSSQLEQLQQVIGSNATNNDPNLRKKIGGRDIFRALSTVQPLYTPTMAQRKMFEQSLDDQKEEEGFDENLPPPPPPPVDENGEPLPPEHTITVVPGGKPGGVGIIDHQQLVKPSALFGKMREQQQQQQLQPGQPQQPQQRPPRPAYLREDNVIANHNRQ